MENLRRFVIFNTFLGLLLLLDINVLNLENFSKLFKEGLGLNIGIKTTIIIIALMIFFIIERIITIIYLEIVNLIEKKYSLLIFDIKHSIKRKKFFYLFIVFLFLMLLFIFFIYIVFKTTTLTVFLLVFLITVVLAFYLFVFIYLLKNILNSSNNIVKNINTIKNIILSLLFIPALFFVHIYFIDKINQNGGDGVVRNFNTKTSITFYNNNTNYHANTNINNTNTTVLNILYFHLNNDFVRKFNTKTSITFYNNNNINYHANANTNNINTTVQNILYFYLSINFFLLCFIYLEKVYIFDIKNNELYTINKINILIKLIFIYIILIIILIQQFKNFELYQKIFKILDSISIHFKLFAVPVFMVFLLTSLLVQDFIKNLVSGLLIIINPYIKERNSYIKINDEIFYIKDIKLFNTLLENKDDEIVTLSNYNFLTNIDEKFKIIKIIERVSNYLKEVNFTFKFEINNKLKYLFTICKKNLEIGFEEILKNKFKEVNIDICNIDNCKNDLIKLELERNNDIYYLKVNFNFKIEAEPPKILVFAYFEEQNQIILKTLFEVIKEYNKYIKNNF